MFSSVDVTATKEATCTTCLVHSARRRPCICDGLDDRHGNVAGRSQEIAHERVEVIQAYVARGIVGRCDPSGQLGAKESRPRMREKVALE